MSLTNDPALKATTSVVATNTTARRTGDLLQLDVLMLRYADFGFCPVSDLRCVPVPDAALTFTRRGGLARTAVAAA